jgi:hypothetical protein
MHQLVLIWGTYYNSHTILLLGPRPIFGWYEAGTSLVSKLVWNWYKAGITRGPCHLADIALGHMSLVGSHLAVLILVLVPGTGQYSRPTLDWTYKHLQCITDPIHLVVTLSKSDCFQIPNLNKYVVTLWWQWSLSLEQVSSRIAIYNWLKGGATSFLIIHPSALSYPLYRYHNKPLRRQWFDCRSKGKDENPHCTIGSFQFAISTLIRWNQKKVHQFSIWSLSNFEWWIVY